MSGVALPNGMPAPLAAGHEMEYVDLCESIQMDSGRTRRRALYSGQPRTVSLSWRLTQTQFDAFHAWWLGAAKQGGVVLSLPYLQPNGTVDVADGVVMEPPAYDLQQDLTWTVSLRALLGGVAAALAAMDPTYVHPAPARRNATMAVTVPESPAASFTLQAPVRAQVLAADALDTAAIQLWYPLALGTLAGVEAVDIADLQASARVKSQLSATDAADTASIYIGYVTFSCLNHALGSGYAPPAGSGTDLQLSSVSYTAPQAAGCGI